jgi:hypothetical protein
MRTDRTKDPVQFERAHVSLSTRNDDQDEPGVTDRALERAGDGWPDHVCVQAHRGSVNIVVGGGRASNSAVALVAGLASAVTDPERSAL